MGRNGALFGKLARPHCIGGATGRRLRRCRRVLRLLFFLVMVLAPDFPDGESAVAAFNDNPAAYLLAFVRH